MQERVTLVDGRKVKRIVEVFQDEKQLEALKAKAALIMIKHRLEELIKN
jgi:hypothetical protein